MNMTIMNASLITVAVMNTPSAVMNRRCASQKIMCVASMANRTAMEHA